MSKDDEATPPPYLFRLRGIGTFRYTGEYLMLLTSRGPWGQMRLPTVSFADLEVGAADEEIAEG
jgi:hypothetical protein